MSSALGHYFRLAALLLLAALPAAAQQTQRFEVTEVEIVGLSRISPTTVLSQTGFGKGDVIDNQILGQSISRLYESGLFRDVEIGRDGDKVIIRVTENPTIRTIRFEGMTELDEDRVLDLLSSRDIAPGQIYKRGDAEFISNGVRSFYIQVNRYLSDAKTVTVPLGDNRVDLVIEVDESEEARINSINFYGVTAFDKDDLLDQMELKVSSLVDSFFDRDAFSTQTLEADLGRLRSYYADSGYVRFEILSTDVSVDARSGQIAVDIYVSEGARYSFAGVQTMDPAGALVEAPPEPEFAAGDTFSDQLVEEQRDRLRSVLRNLGYAFADVRAETLVNDANLEVLVRYLINPGGKVVVREIRFVGNNITDDNVLRRNMELLEGELFSEDKLEWSLTRLRRTNYLNSAIANESRFSDDQVDIEVVIDEANRGNFLIGAGYSSVDKLGFQLEFNRSNILGTGKDFDAKFEFDNNSNEFSLGLQEPNITDSGIARRFSLFNEEEEPDTTSATNNSFNKLGGTIGYTIPLDREWSWTAGAELSKIDINNHRAIILAGPVPIFDTSTPPKRFPTNFAYEYALKHGVSQISAIASLGAVYDTRDSTFLTTKGLRSAFNFDTSVAGISDASFYKLSNTTSYYRSLSRDKDTTLNIRGTLLYGDAYGSAIYPYYERYYLSSSDLRGFDPESIRILDSRGTNIGGKFLTSVSAQADRQLDILDGESVSAGLFVDVAGIWDDFSDASDNLGDVRMSAGIEIKIRTPLFPLSLSYGIPIRKQEGDKAQNFQFKLGF